METQSSLYRMEIDFSHNVNSKRHCTLENGGLKSRLGNFEEVGGEGDTKTVALYPITPVSCLESGESVLVMSTSLSLESSQSLSVDEGLNSGSSDEVVDSGFEDSPRTPGEGTFNPFAPGPENMCLAPCKRVVKGNKRIVARRLSFDDVAELPSSKEDDMDAEIHLEKMLLETVYGTILEAIIMNLSLEFLADNRDLELGGSGCLTPTSPCHPVNGIAETCPEAPAKTTGRKSMNIDPGLCKKLEF